MTTELDQALAELSESHWYDDLDLDLDLDMDKVFELLDTYHDTYPDTDGVPYQ